MECIKNFVINVVFGIDTGSLSGFLAVVVALFMPVAILIYEEFKEQRAFNEFNWEKTVLLQDVINGWQILSAVLMSAISVVFWNYQNIWTKLIMLILFTIGIVLLIKNLICLFKWFLSDKVGNTKYSDYRQKKKIKFLKSLDPNKSLDVWSDLFKTIELENAYLKDYLTIFLDKFSKASKGSCWQYEACLTRNMERLYYWNPDFQNTIVDFVFDAYLNDGAERNEARIYKRQIVRKVARLLAKNEESHYFSISQRFDEKLSNLKDGDDVLKCVENYSFDVLNEVLSVYDEIPGKDNYYSFEIFPIHEWSIASLPSSKNARDNTKAMGLFLTYLRIMPSYVKNRDNGINEKRGEFLDEIVFGLSGRNLSRRIIRIVNLYFGQTFFTSYVGEDDNHALIRNFIDNDYRYYFLDSSCSVSSGSIDPDESEEQRLKRIMQAFRAEEEKRDNNTLKLLTSVYRFLLNTKEMKKIGMSLSKYSLADKKYKYETDIMIVEDNLKELKDTIGKIIKYGGQKSETI